MGVLRGFVGFCDAAIRIMAGLVQVAIGIALIGACGWIAALGYTHPILVVFLGLVGVVGFVLAIQGLGRITGPPVPHVPGSVRVETRRALRRAGMLRKR